MSDGWRATNRWRGVVGVTLAAGAVGLLAQRPLVLLLGVVGVVFAVYPRASPRPVPQLTLERRVDRRTTGHGEPVTVTTTVRNAGEAVLPDVRIVDGVPPALGVSEGSPRHGTALRPGEAASFSYRVAARPGRHRFEPATIVVRDLSGASERELTLEATTRTEIDCRATETDPRLRAQTIEYVGRLRSKEAGTGVEFYGIREHWPGDPLNRMDWNRFARTGERTTVEFRRELAATVVLAVDAREAAYRGAPDQPHAVACSVAAAERLAGALLDAHNRVGVQIVGRDPGWLPPGAGADHRARVRRLFGRHPTIAAAPSTTGAPLDEQMTDLRTRLPADAQVVLLSPLADDAVTAAVRRLEAYGHAVSVICPDATGEGTVGRRLAAVERANRVAALRRTGVPVTEWSPATPLSAALERTNRGLRA